MSRNPQETMFTVNYYGGRFDVHITYTRPFETPFDYDQPPEQTEYEIFAIYLNGDTHYDVYGILNNSVIERIEEEVKEQFIEFINE